MLLVVALSSKGVRGPGSRKTVHTGKDVRHHGWKLLHCNFGHDNIVSLPTSIDNKIQDMHIFTSS
jgi:hypothetical protein